jgi:hypothetical protein
MPEKFQQGNALIVGVGADLPMTAYDAKQVADMLLDERRCAYPTEQVTLLTGDKAGRNAVLRGLERLATAGPDSTAVVYFSGHGIETPGYHLLPFGYDLHALPATAISGAEFSAALQAIRARKLLVLLDCCHAGGQGDLEGIAKAPVPAEALASLARGSGRVIIASSRKDELSWAGASSYFTAALLEALAGSGAAESDGYARVLDIALWVGRRVPELTRDRQHPMIKVSNLEDNFAVAWYAGGGKAVSPLPGSRLKRPAPAALGMAGADDLQRANWQKMLANYRQNLLLIEERMSEFVEFSSIPLQLVRGHRQVEATITDLEQKLGLG